MDRPRLLQNCLQRPRSEELQLRDIVGIFKYMVLRRRVFKITQLFCLWLSRCCWERGTSVQIDSLGWEFPVLSERAQFLIKSLHYIHLGAKALCSSYYQPNSAAGPGRTRCLAGALGRGHQGLAVLWSWVLGRQAGRPLTEDPVPLALSAYRCPEEERMGMELFTAYLFFRTGRGCIGYLWIYFLLLQQRCLFFKVKRFILSEEKQEHGNIVLI